MSLAAKLPFRHPYAAGFPGLGSQPVPTDADALDYLDRMAAADGTSVEVGVAVAVDAFVADSKALGVWDSIRSSCILAGARTLAGALVPLRDYGPQLVDIDSLPTPTITDADGSAGVWNAATRTMLNTSQTAGNPGYPRFGFAIAGIEAGKSYKVTCRVSGDIAAVTQLRLANSGGTAVPYDSSTGVFDGTVSAATSNYAEFSINGSLAAPISVTIDSLSIREVIAAPTNVANGFVNGDYSRTAGLTGDGTSYIDSGRANDDDPQNDFHVAAYLTAITDPYIAAAGPTTAVMTLATTGARNRSGTAVNFSSTLSAPGLCGSSRASSSTVDVITNGIKTSASNTSSAPGSDDINVFGYVYSGLISQNTIAFYSIGTSLSLADLDTAVSNLLTRLKFALNTGLNPSGYAIEAVDWANRVYDNGGTASKTTIKAVSDFCNAIDAAGIRDRFYRLNLFAGTGLNAALVPLYRGPTYGGTTYGNATDTNNGPFVSGDYVETGASGGLLGNGSSKYLDTGLAPSDYQANANTGHISAYHSQPTGANVNRSLIACNSASSFRRFWLVSDIFSTSAVQGLYGSTFSATESLGTQVGAAAGHRLVSRTAGNSLTHYVNAAAVASNATDITTTNDAIADDFYILARNDNGTADRFGNSRVMAYSIGEGITSQQASDYYNAMQTFQTALSREL